MSPSDVSHDPVAVFAIKEIEAKCQLVRVFARGVGKQAREIEAREGRTGQFVNDESAIRKLLSKQGSFGFELRTYLTGQVGYRFIHILRKGFTFQ
jgi:hypothetical protein